MAEKMEVAAVASGGGGGGGAGSAGDHRQGASPSPAAGHAGHAALANPKPKKRTRTSSRGSVEALMQSKNSTASATTTTTTTTGKENELSKESNAASTPLSPQLMALMERKEILERVLENLETQIYALETSYLEDTHSRGNIVRGWESFRARRGAVSHKRVRVSDKNRIFSLSSATAYKVVGTSAAAFPCKDEDDDKAKDASPHTHHVDNHL
ncbi:Chromatin modification-related protein meaf6 [Balamuthia mandrillaris]